MGGNAIKNTFVRRYERDEFEVLSTEVLAKIEQHFSGVCSEAKIIPYYKNKPSFGDMDVIVRPHEYAHGKNHAEIIRSITEAFGTAEIYCNDGVYSFPYRELQIDIIFAKPGAYESSLNYFSFNDLGNLLGRIAKSTFNLSYGHDGLHYPIRNENGRLLDSILITRDHTETLKLLGLDLAKFKDGFSELKDVYDYVVSSPFFRKSFFDLGNLNHINRVRNRKRASYMGFLEYISALPEKEPLDAVECNNILHTAFPWLVGMIATILRRHEAGYAVKKAAREAAKFHFGIDNGSAICEAMVAFRAEYAKNPDITPEYAAQIIFNYKRYGYNTR